ncbi:hypothetical protein [Nocardia sp. NPDC051463]|uniref:hypothetical protein n=1 Tax=Nocardia sp. NPDC051463 TaxID=3154845 RepID=UPI003433006F
MDDDALDNGVSRIVAHVAVCVVAVVRQYVNHCTVCSPQRCRQCGGVDQAAAASGQGKIGIQQIFAQKV